MRPDRIAADAERAKRSMVGTRAGRDPAVVSTVAYPEHTVAVSTNIGEQDPPLRKGETP